MAEPEASGWCEEGIQLVKGGQEWMSRKALPIGRAIVHALEGCLVFKTAQRHGKALEINAYPERLDLDDVHGRRAGELGVLVAINTDTHVLDHLASIELGVATARRAWLEVERGVNAWPAQKFLAWARAGHGTRTARKA